MAKRIERQEHNRAKILSAARDEFVARGYRDAKIDAIATRAGLTRGAVYSNFAGKQALYLSALADQADHHTATAAASPHEALEAIARAQAATLPLGLDEAAARLDPGLVPRLLTGHPQRLTYAELLRLQTLLVSFGLERLADMGSGHSLTRMAAMALTLLRGAEETARATPGLNEPFDVVAACQGLAGMDSEVWQPPPVQSSPRPVDTAWDPGQAVDAISGEVVDLSGDGIVGFFGTHRLATVEHLVRGDQSPATVVLLTGEGAESQPLIRYVLSQTKQLLRQGIPLPARPRLRVVFDDAARLAATAGITAVSDATEVAVRVDNGRLVAGTEGFGAGYALAATRDTAVR